MTSGRWLKLADEILDGRPMTRDEGLGILHAPDDDLLEILQGAYLLRRRFFGRAVDLHVLDSVRGGLCSEDCAFCSQSAVSRADVPVFDRQPVGDIVARARRAAELGAVRFCIVTSGRGPSGADMEWLCEAVRRVKATANLQVCASLGLLTDDQACALAEAGVDRYNHNLQTSERFYPQICATHTWADRVATIRAARAAGIEICCGGIIGMGEADEDRVDLALALRDLGADSIPVNFLDPRPGTPLGERPHPSPSECLRALALFRYACPDREIRAAGGRESCLRSLQPLALWVANAMFTEGYLTTPGQGWERDRAMMEDAGFVVGRWGLA